MFYDVNIACYHPTMSIATSTRDNHIIFKYFKFKINLNKFRKIQKNPLNLKIHKF